MSEWMPIETVPKDGSDILLLTPHGITEAHWTSLGWDKAPCAFCSAVELISEPTHWMPLPPPPKTEE